MCRDAIPFHVYFIAMAIGKFDADHWRYNIWTVGDIRCTYGSGGGAAHHHQSHNNSGGAPMSRSSSSSSSSETQRRPKRVQQGIICNSMAVR